MAKRVTRSARSNGTEVRRGLRLNLTSSPGLMQGTVGDSGFRYFRLQLVPGALKCASRQHIGVYSPRKLVSRMSSLSTEKATII